MKQCYQESKEAYKRGDHPRAKELSKKGHHHKDEMARLHAAASAAIFREKNQDRDAYDVDLHGLRVKGAIHYAIKTITNARRDAEPEVRLIVGQGNHAEGGIPRLKPKVQEDLQSHGYRVDVDPKNAGVLIVRLGERR
jgi:DNA-nicking Smr family endonuclease